MIKLELSDFDLNTYLTCAIYSTQPSFKIAYLLNKNLNLKLQRSSKDNIVAVSKSREVAFPFYNFNDDKNFVTYHLFKNKKTTKIEGSDISNSLFETSSIKNDYLLPELKKVDYILKIETEDHDFDLENLVSKIGNINQIIACHEVDYETIKSKNNLITE